MPNFKTIAIPGMGTGVGGVSYKAAAEAMTSIAKEFEEKFDEIILIDRNEEMVESFIGFI